MTESPGSDVLKRLVIFMIALAILGTILALAWHFGVELPMQQAALHATTNAVNPNGQSPFINTDDL